MSSSTWEPPYASNSNPSSNNPTSAAGISPIVAHSNGPGGGGGGITQSVTEIPRASAIHQPAPTYSSSTASSPYLHHPPPYSHALPPGPVLGPYSSIPSGPPPLIHPYPPLTTASGGPNPVHYNHHGGHPPNVPPPSHHYPAPPPPYAAPIHGHPAISPTHTTTSTLAPPGGAPPLHVGQQQGVGPPPPSHHVPYNLKVGGGGQPVQKAGLPHQQQQHPGLGVGPVPQTPIGPPIGGNPFGPSGPELDLHPELVAIGWRKFWSKRESRWYFWNCNSGESLWELPSLPGRHPPPGQQQGVRINSFFLPNLNLFSYAICI